MSSMIVLVKLPYLQYASSNAKIKLLPIMHAIITPSKILCSIIFKMVDRKLNQKLFNLVSDFEKRHKLEE